ncbi:MAG: hypothetical protein LC655_03090, partial [Bacteroidales bacterium]|nr:hypothetical protein [Bacteroidales bacterium]
MKLIVSGYQVLLCLQPLPVESALYLLYLRDTFFPTGGNVYDQNADIKWFVVVAVVVRLSTGGGSATFA